MAGKTDRTGVQYAFKKLSGRANTSNIKSDAQEVIGSNIQVGTQTIFGQNIPISASRIDYQLYSASQGADATAEYVVFTVAAITGTTYDADSATGGGGDGSQSAGPHGYKLIMTGNYEALSSNPKKGTDPFINDRLVHETLGGLQLVPPNFSQESPNPYILKIYEADGSDANQIGDEIPLLDEVDWTFDYYNGILFLQDYDAGKIPAFAKGFIYVGNYLSATLGSATGTPGGANTQVQFNDGGSFGGDSNFTFNKNTDTMTVASMSGALTRLSDGKSYLVGGDNVTIASASNGQITISSTGGGGSGGSSATFFSSTTAGSIFTTGSTAFVGAQSSPAAPDAPSDIGNDVFFFVSGTVGSQGTSNTGSAVFGGDVVISGALNAKQGVGTLATSTSVIHISASNAPSSGSVLVAKSSTQAAWQQAIIFGEQPSGTKNGSNLTFTLDNAVINNTDLMLFVNGLLQLSGSSNDYTLTGSQINFNPGLAPLSDDAITAIYRPST